MADILKIQGMEPWDTAVSDDDDRCMLNPNKICDNCFQCIDNNLQDYADIPIDKIEMTMEDSVPYDIFQKREILVSTLYGVHRVRKKKQ